jgi:hypothetical protein
MALSMKQKLTREWTALQFGDPAKAEGFPLNQTRVHLTVDRKFHSNADCGGMQTVLSAQSFAPTKTVKKMTARSG